jgi:hypothetical protein
VRLSAGTSIGVQAASGLSTVDTGREISILGAAGRVIEASKQNEFTGTHVYVQRRITRIRNQNPTSHAELRSTRCAELKPVESRTLVANPSKFARISVRTAPLRQTAAPHPETTVALCLTSEH